MEEITTQIIEQPGAISRAKAAQIGRLIAKLLTDADFRAEVERRIADSKEGGQTEC